MLQKLSTVKARMNALFRPNGKVFYGWWIVLACAGVQWLAAMTWMHSYGAYTLHLQEEFGWSMSILSLAFALCLLYTSPSPRDGLLSRMPSSA